jgi:HAD superfamily hydrolase (TIGR01484 family)
VLRCVYTDLDGTLVGPDGSLFHDVEGSWSNLAARGLEAAQRGGAEIVPVSGRRREGVRVVSRLLGTPAYIYEVGAGLVIDGHEEFLTGDLQPTADQTIFEQITASGALELLFEHFGGLLEFHSPWHLNREVSHLLRGDIDVFEANKLLDSHGHESLRLVENGMIVVDGKHVHAYHLMPRAASKVRAVARHMQARAYAREETIAVGDSREDLEMAEVVGRFFLVANAVENDPSIRDAIGGRPNISITEAAHGEGFYEAVVRSLAEQR